MSVPALLGSRPYRPRPLRFIRRQSIGDWRLKVRGIAADPGRSPRAELVDAALGLPPRTCRSPASPTCSPIPPVPTSTSISVGSSTPTSEPRRTLMPDIYTHGTARRLRLAPRPSLLSPLQVLRRAAGIVIEWERRARERRSLGEMTDHMLKDLGVTRSDAKREAEKPFWRP